MPHIHDKIDFTVEVFIVHENKVLLRKHEKYNIWLSVGGHIELDEDPNQAAIREVKEEVGLDVELINTKGVEITDSTNQELVPPVGLNRHRINSSHEHVSLVYFAKSTSDQVIPEKESDEWRWVTESEIENLDPISPQVIFYAKKALEVVK